MVGPDNGRTEAGLRTLGRLMPGALHELGNSLLALGGTIELLLAGAEPGTKTERRLETLRRTSDEAAEVVKALQKLARERLEPEAELDLGLFVTETAALARRFSVVKNVELDVTVGRVAPLRARPAAIRVALLDAMLDALEAADTDTRVRVGVDATTVRIGGVDVAFPTPDG